MGAQLNIKSDDADRLASRLSELVRRGNRTARVILDSSAILAIGLREPDRFRFVDAMLAKETREPLLFKGNDFAQTAVEPASKD